MRIFILVAILFIGSLKASCQIDEQFAGISLNAPVKQLISDSLKAHDKVLDYGYVLTRKTTNANKINVDTLRDIDVTKDGLTLYHISALADNGTNTGGGERAICFRVKNKVLTLEYNRTSDGIGYAGVGNVAKATWNVAIVNNWAIVQLTGVLSQNITWTIFEKNKPF